MIVDQQHTSMYVDSVTSLCSITDISEDPSSAVPWYLSIDVNLRSAKCDPKRRHWRATAVSRLELVQR